MNSELFAGITVVNLIYLSVVLVMGVALALTTRFVAERVKRRLRRRTRTNLVAQVVDDLEEPVFLWILMLAMYLVMLGLPLFADSEDALANYRATLRRGFTVASIVLVVYGTIRVQGDALRWYVRRVGRRTAQAKVLNSLVPMARRIVSIIIVAMGVLVILDQLGVSIAPLIAGLGIGGLAVALALQGTLTNFFAGVNVLTDGSIRVGDFVELESGLRGNVDQIGWRTTRIRMLANNMVIIPNSKLAESVATNYNYPVDEMSVYVELGVGYSSDLEHVERVTLEVARKVMEETEGSVKEYEPSVWYTEFGDSNINFWVVLRANAYLDSWRLKHNFIKALFRRYNEEGIEISFPNTNIFMRDGTAEPKSLQAVDEKVRKAVPVERQQARRGRTPPPRGVHEESEDEAPTPGAVEGPF